jgi:hypothetical protein
VDGGQSAQPGYQDETSAKSYVVILSVAKDLVFTGSYEILRSLRALGMTDAGTSAEVSRCVQIGNRSLVGADIGVSPGLRAHTQVRPCKSRFILLL